MSVVIQMKYKRYVVSGASVRQHAIEYIMPTPTTTPVGKACMRRRLLRQAL